jgi:hypothetical protein
MCIKSYWFYECKTNSVVIGECVADFRMSYQKRTVKQKILRTSGIHSICNTCSRIAALICLSHNPSLLCCHSNREFQILLIYLQTLSVWVDYRWLWTCASISRTIQMLPSSWLTCCPTYLCTMVCFSIFSLQVWYSSAIIHFLNKTSYIWVRANCACVFIVESLDSLSLNMRWILCHCGMHWLVTFNFLQWIMWT